MDGMSQEFDEDTQVAEKTPPRKKKQKRDGKKPDRRRKKNKRKDTKKSDSAHSDEPAQADVESDGGTISSVLFDTKETIEQAGATTEGQPEEGGFAVFYEMIHDELTRTRDALVDNEACMVMDTGALFWMIPHPPRRTVTSLCCCTKCCGRCCDIYGHQEAVHHRLPETTNVGTDSNDVDDQLTAEAKGAKVKIAGKKAVVLNVEPNLSDAQDEDKDTASLTEKSRKVTPGEVSVSTGDHPKDLPSGKQTRKTDEDEALAAAREAKHSLSTSKLLRKKSEHLQRVRCNTPHEAGKRDLYVAAMLKKAEAHANNAQKCMAKYRALKKKSKSPAPIKGLKKALKDEADHDTSSLDLFVLTDSEDSNTSLEMPPDRAYPKVEPQETASEKTYRLSEDVAGYSGVPRQFPAALQSTQPPGFWTRSPYHSATQPVQPTLQLRPRRETVAVLAFGNEPLTEPAAPSMLTQNMFHQEPVDGYRQRLPQVPAQYGVPAGQFYERSARQMQPFSEEETRVSSFTASALNFSEGVDKMARHARDAVNVAATLKKMSDDVLQNELYLQSLQQRGPISSFRDTSLPKSRTLPSKSLTFKSATSDRRASDHLAREETSSEKPVTRDASITGVGKRGRRKSVASSETSRIEGRPRPQFKEDSRRKSSFRRKDSVFVHGNLSPLDDVIDEGKKPSGKKEAADVTRAATNLLLKDDNSQISGYAFQLKLDRSDLKIPGSSEKMGQNQVIVTVCDRGTSPVADQATSTPTDWINPPPRPSFLSSLSRCCLKDKEKEHVKPQQRERKWFFSSCSPCAEKNTESSGEYVTSRSMRSSITEPQTPPRTKAKQPNVRPTPAPRLSSNKKDPGPSKKKTAEALPMFDKSRTGSTQDQEILHAHTGQKSSARDEVLSAIDSGVESPEGMLSDGSLQKSCSQRSTSHGAAPAILSSESVKLEVDPLNDKMQGHDEKERKDTLPFVVKRKEKRTSVADETLNITVLTNPVTQHRPSVMVSAKSRRESKQKQFKQLKVRGTKVEKTRSGRGRGKRPKTTTINSDLDEWQICADIIKEADRALLKKDAALAANLGDSEGIRTSNQPVPEAKFNTEEIFSQADDMNKASKLAELDPKLGGTSSNVPEIDKSDMEPQERSAVTLKPADWSEPDRLGEVPEVRPESHASPVISPEELDTKENKKEEKENQEREQFEARLLIDDPDLGMTGTERQKVDGERVAAKLLEEKDSSVLLVALQPGSGRSSPEKETGHDRKTDEEAGSAGKDKHDQKVERLQSPEKGRSEYVEQSPRDVNVKIPLDMESGEEEAELEILPKPAIEPIKEDEDLHHVRSSTLPAMGDTAIVMVSYMTDDKFWEFKDSTESLYPESKLGITIALVCAGWVVLILLFTEFEHHVSGRPDERSSRSGSTSTTFTTGNLSSTKGISTREIPAINQTSWTVSRGPASIYFCDTPFCMQEAQYISASLAGDPCENFYHTVCKSRTRSWTSPVAAAVSTDTLLVDHIGALVGEYVANEENTDVDIARSLLRACQLQKNDERLDDVKAIFNDYFGISWPIEASAANLPDVWVVAGHLVRELDLHPIITVSVDAHPERSKQHIAGVDEPYLLLRRKAQSSQLGDLVDASIQESLRLMSRNADFDEITNNIKTTMVSIANFVAAPSARHLGSENYRVSRLHELGMAISSLLKTAFAGYAIIDDHTEVLVKSPFFSRHLKTADILEPRGMLNYLGFRVLLHFGAFISFASLRQMRAMTLGSWIDPDGSNLNNVCLRETERVLPAMHSRALALHREHIRFDAMARIWASRVEEKFQGGITRLSWTRGSEAQAQDSTDLHLARFKFSLIHLRHFFPPWVAHNDSYQAYTLDLKARLANVRTNRVIQLLRGLLRAVQQDKIEKLGMSAAVPTSAGSLFDTLPLYDPQNNYVFVPVAVMNHSIPTSGSLFALHIARFGVRIFKGLLPVIYNNFVFSGQLSGDAPLLFSEAYQRRLQETVRCLLDAFRRAPEFLKSNFLRNLVDVTAAGFSLLEQTVALMQAFWAFQELLNIKRIWKSDFRFSKLPTLSTEQLFFVYYALDNCEASDDDYRSQMFETRFALPPEDRVNFPLLQFEEFKKAFNCPRSSPMAEHNQCVVAV